MRVYQTFRAFILTYRSFHSIPADLSLSLPELFPPMIQTEGPLSEGFLFHGWSLYVLHLENVFTPFCRPFLSPCHSTCSLHTRNLLHPPGGFAFFLQQILLHRGGVTYFILRKFSLNLAGDHSFLHKISLHHLPAINLIPSCIQIQLHPAGAFTLSCWSFHLIRTEISLHPAGTLTPSDRRFHSILQEL